MCQPHATNSTVPSPAVYSRAGMGEWGGSRHSKQADKQDDVRLVIRLGTESRGDGAAAAWTTRDGQPCYRQAICEGVTIKGAFSREKSNAQALREERVGHVKETEEN